MQRCKLKINNGFVRSSNERKSIAEVMLELVENTMFVHNNVINLSN